MASATRSPAPIPIAASAFATRLASALQFRECHGTGFAALAFPKAGDAIRCGPSIQAVVGDIQFAADEPLRPFGPARSIEHARIWLKPLDIHFAQDFTPEPLGLFPRKAQECLAVGESQALHEAPDVGSLDEFAGGLPDHAHQQCNASRNELVYEISHHRASGFQGFGSRNHRMCRRAMRRRPARCAADCVRGGGRSPSARWQNRRRDRTLFVPLHRPLDGRAGLPIARPHARAMDGGRRQRCPKAARASQSG